MEKRLSIVIPCYNEARSIPLILNRFAATIEQRNIEVILVENGSTDNVSYEVMQSLLPSYSFAKMVRLIKNQGYGYGILAGLREAQGNYLGWTHADLQTDPYDVVRAYDIFMEAKDEQLFLKGRRQGRPLVDRFFTAGMSVFESLYLRTSLWDINAQPTIFPVSFFQKWHNPPHDFSLDLYAFYMARQQGLAIERFPVHFGPRQFGVSSWNSGMKARWKFIKRTFTYSQELKKSIKGNKYRS